jgi:hypothetical protein
MRQGTTFYKLPYLKGKPHKRQFKVSFTYYHFPHALLPPFLPFVSFVVVMRQGQAAQMPIQGKLYLFTLNLMQRARDPVLPATERKNKSSSHFHPNEFHSCFPTKTHTQNRSPRTCDDSNGASSPRATSCNARATPSDPPPSKYS